MLLRLFSISLLLMIAAVGTINPVTAQTVPTDAEQIRLSFAPVVKTAAPAVVNVYASRLVEQRPTSPFFDDPLFKPFFDGLAKRPRQRMLSSLGSGVIVDQRGIIVTNNHVIAGADEVKIALSDGREFEADILLKDERTDLAVLRVREPEGPFRSIRFSDSDDAEVGDLVLAIGNPFGVGQTVTQGILSATARTRVGITDLQFFLQTDAAINPGNSGGALVNVRGELIGINTAIFSRSGGSNGIGFAIPSNMAKVVVRSALRSGTVERPWFGSEFQGVNADIARSLGLNKPRGALITAVTKGSPAAAAGLRVGDLVLRIGRTQIKDPLELEYRVALEGIGSQINLTVLRNGRRLKVKVNLGSVPDYLKEKRLSVAGRTPFSGITIAAVTREIAREIKFKGPLRGVAVREVERGTRAERTGLKKGDVIVEINRRKINNIDEMKKAVATQRRGWNLVIIRGNRTIRSLISG
jgi:Do/DeqQ family serine protease